MQQDHKADITVSNSLVCCIADLHIGVHQNSIYWHETAINWAKWLKDELKEKKIKDIFILGDIFHYRDEIAVNTLHTVNEIFKIWKNFNIIMLVGNHDAYYKDRSEINSISIFEQRKNVTVISSTTETTIFGKNVAFIPWGENTKNLTKKDILFGHFEIESFKMNSYKLCDNGIKTSELLDKADLIITGHFHLREERNYNNKKIVYVGNPFEMDFGDLDSTKGYYLLDIAAQELQFFENQHSPKHKKIILSDLLENTNKNYLEDLTKNNIVKLVIDKKIAPDSIDNLLKKVSAYKPFSVAVDYIANTNITINEDLSVDMSGINIEKAIEEFINMLDIQSKEDIIDYCRDLYSRCK